MEGGHGGDARDRPRPGRSRVRRGLDALEATLPYLSLALPFALVTIIGGIDNTESAAAAGDEYRTRDILLTEAGATVLAALCGGVVQNTPYIGHPAYKAMGARAGYTLATGLVIGLGAAAGVLSLLVAVLPEAAISPILGFIGLEIIAQGFLALPHRRASQTATDGAQRSADTLRREPERARTSEYRLDRFRHTSVKWRRSRRELHDDRVSRRRRYERFREVGDRRRRGSCPRRRSRPGRGVGAGAMGRAARGEEPEEPRERDREREDDRRDELRDVPRPQREGRRPRRRRAPAAEAGRLDVGQGREGNRRRDFLEDHERPWRHAALEASPGEGALGAGELHPHAPKEEGGREASSLRRPAGRRRGVRVSGMRVSTIDVGTNTVRLLVADAVGRETWKVVDAHQTVTRLGEGLPPAGPPRRAAR